MKSLCLVLLLIFISCSPTKKLLNEHKYSVIIDDALAKLDANGNDKRALHTLQNAYNSALSQFQNNLIRINSGLDSLKWTRTLEIFQETNDLSNKIKSNQLSKDVFPVLKFYTIELEEAKSKAVGELMDYGKTFLSENKKEKARVACNLFRKASELSPNDKGIKQLVINAQRLATYNVVIDTVRIDFNTLKVATKKIDKEFFYWTQRDVSSRMFVHYFTASEAEKLGIDPDYYIQLVVLDYRVEKIPTISNGSNASNLMALGNLRLNIYSSEKHDVVFRKNISCRFDSETKSTIRVNTIDLQRIIDPDIQTFFDYMILSNFDRITEETDNYFNTLVKQ